MLLTALRLARDHDWSPFGPPSPYNAQSLADIVSRLTRLRELDLEGMVNTIPAQFGQLSHLEDLRLLGGNDTWESFSIPSSLSLCSMEMDDSMLHRLSLHQVHLLPADPPQWAFNPRLTQLSIEGCGFSPLLGGLTSLFDLCLGAGEDTAGSELPAGPYLERLTTLSLERPFFDSLPPALSLASSLQRLVL